MHIGYRTDYFVTMCEESRVIGVGLLLLLLLLFCCVVDVLKTIVGTPNMVEQ